MESVLARLPVLPATMKGRGHLNSYVDKCMLKCRSTWRFCVCVGMSLLGFNRCLRWRVVRFLVAVGVVVLQRLPEHLQLWMKGKMRRLDDRLIPVRLCMLEWRNLYLVVRFQQRIVHFFWYTPANFTHVGRFRRWVGHCLLRTGTETTNIAR